MFKFTDPWGLNLKVSVWGLAKDELVPPHHFHIPLTSCFLQTWPWLVMRVGNKPFHLSNIFENSGFFFLTTVKSHRESSQRVIYFKNCLPPLVIKLGSVSGWWYLQKVYENLLESKCNRRLESLAIDIMCSMNSRIRAYQWAQNRYFART